MTGNPFASCQNNECKSKDNCKRFNKENAIINFANYYKDDKCEYYIEKDIEKEKLKNE